MLVNMMRLYSRLVDAMCGKYQPPTLPEAAQQGRRGAEQTWLDYHNATRQSPLVLDTPFTAQSLVTQPDMSQIETKAFIFFSDAQRLECWNRMPTAKMEDIAKMLGDSWSALTSPRLHSQ